MLIVLIDLSCFSVCVCSEEPLEDEKVFEVVSELDNEQGMLAM